MTVGLGSNAAIAHGQIWCSGNEAFTQGYVTIAQAKHTWTPNPTSLFCSSLSTAIDALRSTSRQLRQRALRTAAVSRSRNLGRRSAALGHALVLLADLLGDAARIADGGRISVIAVNTY
jgi:hypothetical protein